MAAKESKSIVQRSKNAAVCKCFERGRNDNQKDFWANADVKREVNNILKKTKTTDLNNDEYTTVLAYLAAIIMYKNSQRPGVVENMTINEFQNRKDQDKGKVLARVLKHKTSAGQHYY